MCVCGWMGWWVQLCARSLRDLFVCVFGFFFFFTYVQKMEEICMPYPLGKQF